MPVYCFISVVASGDCREQFQRRDAETQRFGKYFLAPSRPCDFALNSRLVFHRISVDSPAMEIVFTVTQESDGGYVAECLSHDIFTQGNTWEELRANVR